MKRLGFLCKILWHDWWALDFCDFGWSVKACSRCSIQNYYIDEKSYLHILDHFVKSPDKKGVSQ